MPSPVVREVRATLLVAALMAIPSLHAGLACAEEQTSPRADISFNIPAQDVATALEAFGQQSGKSIMFDRDRIGRVMLKPVVGRFTAEQALRHLIDGSGLAMRSADQNTFVIEPAPISASELEKGFRLAAADVASTAEIAAARGAESVKLEEIVVTATKREQRLQDVPISIAAVTADDIDRRGLIGAADYLRGIPGVSQMDGAPGQAIVIRGIEVNTTFQGFRGGETTGTYLGETPTNGAAGMLGSNVDIKVVDVERVEVLRGPQGTAFGSASMGGTVRTIPVAPKLDVFAGRIATGYSLTSGKGDHNYNVQAVGNIPLVTDRIAIRASAYRFSDSGYYSNRAGSSAAFQSALAIPFAAQDFAIDADEVGAQAVSGGRVSALLQANDNLRFTVSYLTQKNETDGVPISTSGAFEQTTFRVAPEHVRRGETLGVLDQDIDIANAMMEYDLGWAALLGSYSHVKGRTLYMRPFTAEVPLNWAASQLNDSPHTGNVGEVRLATKLDGAWNFLGGLYVEKGDDEFLFSTRWFGDPARGVSPSFGRNYGDTFEQRAMKQRAAFAEATWELIPRWTFTGGARAFKYDRSNRVDRTGGALGNTAAPAVIGHAEDSGTTFRANLSFKPGDDALLYAGWSQGFRIGGPQAGLPSGPVCDPDGDGIVDGTNISIASTRKIDSDEMDNYELGTKLSLLQGRLGIDAAVFRMDWSGMPVSQVISLMNPSLPLCVSGFSANAGEALSDGVEVQVRFQATDSQRIDFGGSYIDARLTEDVPAQGLRAGNRLPGGPRVNANVGWQYGFNLAGHSAFARADAIYVGSFFGNLLNSAILETESYMKLDATMRVMLSNLSIDLYVRNLTNEDAFTFRGATALPAVGAFYGYQLRPRTFGMQLSYEFK